MFNHKTTRCVGLLLCTFFSGGFSETKNIASSQQNFTKVQTTEQLHHALRNALKGSTIELSDATYTGPFALSQDSIILTGQGKDTILKLPRYISWPEDKNQVLLSISGKNCTLFNLNLVSSRGKYITGTGIQIRGSLTNITNVGFHRFATSIQSLSQNNKFSNLSISNGNDGFFILDNGTTFEQITMENMIGHVGFLNGNNNIVYNLTCDNCTEGISVDGNGSRVMNVDLFNSRSHDPLYLQWGIFILSGSRNIVDQFKGQDYQLGTWGEASNSLVRNSEFGTVDIWGTNQTLINIDAGQLLLISCGRGGHQIIKSKAVRLINNCKNVTIIESTFGINHGSRVEGTFPKILGILGLYLCTYLFI